MTCRRSRIARSLGPRTFKGLHGKDAVKDETQRWVEAGIVLSGDTEAVAMCPACGTRPLEVRDQALGDQKTERHMMCPLCGAYNSVLLATDASARAESRRAGAAGDVDTRDIGRSRTDATDKARGTLVAIRSILLQEWDPIGISALPEAHDEYDKYLPEMCRLISKRAAAHELFEYLWRLETEHMGLRGNREKTERSAE